MGPGTAASTAGAGTVGRCWTEEALPDGELPVGLATKALPTVTLLHEVAAGDASASPEPDESAAMLAVNARRACEGGALRQDVGASALAALQGKHDAVPPSVATVTSWGSSKLVCRGLQVAGRDMLMLPIVRSISLPARPSLARAKSMPLWARIRHRISLCRASSQLGQAWKHATLVLIPMHESLDLPLHGAKSWRTSAVKRSLSCWRPSAWKSLMVLPMLSSRLRRLAPSC